jgi:hypothetical protein
MGVFSKIGKGLKYGLNSLTGQGAADALARGTREGVAAQERMAEKNLEFQKEQAEIQREDFAPWREAGLTALGQIQDGMKSGAFSMESFNFRQDPGYQFRMNEGVKALDNSASARGRLLSGAQQKGVNAYAQGMASQEYGNAYNREFNEKGRQYNILSNLNQGGQASAARQAQVSSQLAASSGNIMAQLGQSQNQAQQNIGQARAGAYNQTGNLLAKSAEAAATYGMSRGASGAKNMFAMNTTAQANPYQNYA